MYIDIGENSFSNVGKIIVSMRMYKLKIYVYIYRQTISHISISEKYKFTKKFGVK